MAGRGLATTRQPSTTRSHYRSSTGIQVYVGRTEPPPVAEPIDLDQLKMEIAEFAKLAAEQSAQETESKFKLR